MSMTYSRVSCLLDVCAASIITIVRQTKSLHCQYARQVALIQLSNSSD